MSYSLPNIKFVGLTIVSDDIQDMKLIDISKYITPGDLDKVVKKELGDLYKQYHGEIEYAIAICKRCLYEYSRCDCCDNMYIYHKLDRDTPFRYIEAEIDDSIEEADTKIHISLPHCIYVMVPMDAGLDALYKVTEMVTNANRVLQHSLMLYAYTVF